jgi:hypothetical protein
MGIMQVKLKEITTSHNNSSCVMGLGLEILGLRLLNE